MDYQLHLPDYLAKCINKDQPQLHCNGTCVLMKKIKEKEEGETKKNTVVYECSTFYMHKEYTALAMQAPVEVLPENHVEPGVIDYVFEYNTLVFRPPIG